MTSARRAAAPLHVEKILDLSHPKFQFEIEQEQFDSLDSTAERLRIWQPDRAVVVTAAQRALPHFARAAAYAQRRGLPVLVRKSGGGVVCLGPGALVVTHFYTSIFDSIDRCYQSFAAAMIEAIAVLGVPLTVQRVESSYCSGRFDLAWNSLKVGGMAQRRRLSNGTAAVGVHAVLAVEVRSGDHAREVEDFCEILDLIPVPQRRMSTTVAHCLPERAGNSNLLRECADALEEAFQSQNERHMAEPSDGTSTLTPRSPRPLSL